MQQKSCDENDFSFQNTICRKNSLLNVIEMCNEDEFSNIFYY